MHTTFDNYYVHTLHLKTLQYILLVMLDRETMFSVLFYIQGNLSALSYTVTMDFLNAHYYDTHQLFVSVLWLHHIT